MRFLALRIKETDRQLLQAAAIKRDQSQSELVREALREKVSKILLANEPQEWRENVWGSKKYERQERNFPAFRISEAAMNYAKFFLS